jgi:hypothetical protein
MGDNEKDTQGLEDGRPVEEREDHPPSAEEAQEDIPDPSTVENVGY